MRKYDPVNAMAIEYCREGCLECLIGDDYLYVTPGDIMIFRTDPNLRVINYPSSHYHATTLMVYFDKTSPMLSLHMGTEGFRPEMLVEKYLSGERYHSLLQKNELLINVFETLSAAPEVTKFNSSTAKEFAEMVFADVETAPDLNEFLSRFTCSTCGKRCLLTAPRCSKGQGSQEKAIVIYQEMFPEVELFLADGQIISIVV